jgi:putative oxidoreductase
MFSRIKSPTWAPVPLCLVGGFGFIEHVYTKLLNRPETFASILHAFGRTCPALDGAVDHLD